MLAHILGRTVRTVQGRLSGVDGPRPVYLPEPSSRWWSHSAAPRWKGRCGDTSKDIQTVMLHTELSNFHCAYVWQVSLRHTANHNAGLTVSAQLDTLTLYSGNTIEGNVHSDLR